MVRLLGLGLVAALVLAAGAATREPLTKQEYLSAVRAALDPEATDRLFDKVVNYWYYPREPCRVCRVDTGTLVDEDWLRAERRLRRNIDAVTSRFATLRPPRDIARLHTSWIATLKACSAALRSLEPDQKRFASGDFEHEVADRMASPCVEPLQTIIPGYRAKGYVFYPATSVGFH